VCAFSKIASNHRCKITRRGIDDLQYLGGCGLLLQCLACLGNKPRIIHRNDRLYREVLNKPDLLAGEGLYLLAISGDVAQQRAVLPQRDKQYGAHSAEFECGSGCRAIRRCHRICQIDDLEIRVTT